MVQRIHYRFMDWRMLEFSSFLFSLQRMNWILHLNIFFNIFLNLIFLLLFFARLEFMITSQLIFKEFPIS